MDRISFNRPFIVGKELYYIAEAVIKGHTAGDGPFTHRCHELMQNRFHIEKVLLTHSCTAALEMAAILCDVGPGDEVILPSFTFVSTANAFYLRGATLKFIDIRPDTLNMDETLLEKMITPKTKVIVPVHYAGVSCEMDSIMKIAAKYGIFVVEDAAQGLGARYKGKFLGSLGHLGAFSFHETKNVISGEGGALTINENRFYERAEIIREKGTNRRKFYRGEVDKYTWMDVGSSYLPSDIIAAFLYGQLENIDLILQKRREIWEFYERELSPLAREGFFELPTIPKECEHNHHIFQLILPTPQLREEFLEEMKKNEIGAVFHYVPLHLSPVGERLGGKKGDLPVTESYSARLVRLPLYYSLAREQQEFIVKTICRFFARKSVQIGPVLEM